MRSVLPLSCVVALLIAPRCAHADAARDELPLYEELLFAQITKEKPRQRYEFPYDNILIEDEVPPGCDGLERGVKLTRLQDQGWENFRNGSASESIGRPDKGRLKNGREMPREGPGFVRKNDKAIYGTDETVAIILWAAARMSQMYPGTVPIVVGDLSRKHGGRLRPHCSHQSGRDVDLGYYFKGNKLVKRFQDATKENLDVEKSWSMIELLLSTQRVQYIFIDRSLQPLFYAEARRRGWSEKELMSLFEAPIGARPRSGIIRHQKGHRNHFHVRFTCDPGDSKCR